MTEKEINELIKAEHLDTNQISDGYHTFGELYEHRIANYLVVCACMCLAGKGYVWRTLKHSDGSHWEGWFVLGISHSKGKQITYHLPMKYWESCEFVEIVEKAPEFDGHTSEDVLDRLALLRLVLLEKLKK